MSASPISRIVLCLTAIVGLALPVYTSAAAQSDSVPPSERAAAETPSEPAAGWDEAEAKEAAESPVDGAAAPAALPQEPAKNVNSASDTTLRPRLEAHAPSVSRLSAKAQGSRGGWFLAQLGRLYMARAEESVDGLKPDDIREVLALAGQWPDTGVNFFVFAPDLRGRPQWAARVDWPIDDLARRFGELLAIPGVREVAEGVRVLREDNCPPRAHNGDDPGGKGNSKSLKNVAIDDNSCLQAYRVALGKETLGYLVAVGGSKSALASHRDLPIPVKSSVGGSTGQSDGSPLLAARWTLAATEADSGATFLSSFSAVSGIVYAGSVKDDGEWSEKFEVQWPPLSGMGAKAIFSRVKQTFFVPSSAFGALAMNSALLPGMLESMAGFGPQVIMHSPGEMEFIGEAGIGPIAASIDGEICLTVLPGVGFLPAPELVVQAKVGGTKVIDRIRRETEKLNTLYQEREREAPWKEATVAGRTVFWSDGSGNSGGMFVPFVMRPVLFVNEERDAADKTRNFLVIGFTTTSPQGFVRRWLDHPRGDHRVFVPSEKKTDGQAWINWDVIYRHVVPYVNVVAGSVIPGAVLPNLEEGQSKWTPSWATAELGYTGLTVTMNGPIPVGSFVLPSMGFAAAEPDDWGTSDLARERLATQRLEVLYHHAKLFKKDLNRWPAEVVELDGYVDFSGNRHLLELNLSSRKQWADWFSGIFESDKDEKKSESGEFDEHLPKIDTKLYKIEWGKERWTLGLAPNTLEHLEKLYIDQDGVIHRVLKNANVPAAADEAETDRNKEASARPLNEQTIEKTSQRAMKNSARRNLQEK